MKRVLSKSAMEEDSTAYARYGHVRDIAAVRRNRAQNAAAVYDTSTRTIAPPAPINLVARQFQSALYARAKQQNVIAVVDTGCGKTFIASMLIRDAINSEISARQQGQAYSKIGFFVVDKVCQIFTA